MTNKKDFSRAGKILSEIKGKSEEEMIDFLIKKGVLKINHKTKEEFKIKQIRRSIVDRILIWIKNPSLNFPNKIENIIVLD